MREVAMFSYSIVTRSPYAEHWRRWCATWMPTRALVGWDRVFSTQTVHCRYPRTPSRTLSGMCSRCFRLTPSRLLADGYGGTAAVQVRGRGCRRVRLTGWWAPG